MSPQAVNDGHVTSGRPQQMARGLSLPEGTPKMSWGLPRSLAEPRTPRALAPEQRRAGTSELWPRSWAQAFLPHLSGCCSAVWKGEAVGRRGRKEKLLDTQRQPCLLAVKALPLTPPPQTHKERVGRAGTGHSGSVPTDSQPCFQKLTEWKVYP